MSKLLGIDLGTTHSLIAMVDAGIPLVLADDQGRRLTPSVVHFPGDGPPIVGWPALRQRALSPSSTFYSVKRFMGRRIADLPPDEPDMPYAVTAGRDGMLALGSGERLLAPEEISAEVLKHLRHVAESALGESVTRAVITVPAYFNDAQRTATKRAGELAGFSVERILNEPTAAALAYGLDRLGQRSRIAVYDLGGGTFDLSILELDHGVFEVLSTSGNPLLGGDDIDRRLIALFGEEIRRAGGPPPAQNPPLLARVREAAEQAKIQLSTVESCEVSLPFLSPSFSYHRVLTRQELESESRDLLLRTKEHCLRALADARLEPADLDQVILVGGQTRMPLVRRLVGEWFGCVEFEETRGAVRVGATPHRAEGPLLNTSQNPDEAVALGAAIQGEILSGGLGRMVLLDVTPLSLGLETYGGLMNVIIPRNTTIPVKAGEVFTTAADQQRSMLIHVLQGERERARDNWSLGRFTLEFEPAPRGTARVGVQFAIDANGILQVLARDIHSGAEKQVQLTSAINVDDQAVQTMVEESVEHAFTDLAARRWVESRIRAAEALAAAEQALARHGTELDPAAAAAIDSACRGVQAALARRDDDATAEDVATLKRAVATLDSASLPLADLLVERAVEDSLRRRGLLPPG